MRPKRPDCSCSIRVNPFPDSRYALDRSWTERGSKLDFWTEWTLPMIAATAIERHHERLAAEQADAERERDAWLMQLADILIAGEDDERLMELKDQLGLSDADLLAMERAIVDGRRLAGLASIADRLTDDARGEKFRRAARKFAAERSGRLDDARVADCENAARPARDAGAELQRLADTFPALFDRSTDTPCVRGDSAEQLGDAAHDAYVRRVTQSRLDRVDREIATGETYVARGGADADNWRHWVSQLKAEKRRLQKTLDGLTDPTNSTTEKASETTLDAGKDA